MEDMNVSSMPAAWDQAFRRVMEKASPQKANAYRPAFRRLIEAAGQFDQVAFDRAARTLPPTSKAVWEALKRELNEKSLSVTTGVRREVLHFTPGDLGVTVLPFRRPVEVGEWIGCVQRPINTNRLKRLAKVGLDNLVTESFSRPIVIFEGEGGERKLAGGHHRLTLANLADHPTDWVVEIRTRESWAQRGDWLAQLAALNLNEGGHVRTDEIVLHRNFQLWRPLLPDNISIYSGRDVSVFGILDGRTLADWYLQEGRRRYKVNPGDRAETMETLVDGPLETTVGQALRWREKVVQGKPEKVRKFLVAPPVMGAWFVLASQFPDREHRMMDRINQYMEFLDLTAKGSVQDAAKALLSLINRRVRGDLHLTME